MTDRDLQERADRLVHNNVNCCLSSLVATLAQADPRNGDRTVLALIEQARELARPVDDYEEAAREAGFKIETVSGEEREWVWVRRDANGEAVNDASLMSDNEADVWRACCEYNGIDPYEREVFEHWSISQFLADQLIAHGERVDTDFAGLNVWARTTTGQLISMDSVIQKIVREL